MWIWIFHFSRVYHTPHTTPHTITTTTTGQGSTRLLSFCGALFVEPLVGDIMADVAHAAGAAKRRRERRLRAMLRHERRSVAMALAEFTHHSSRGQRTARAWEEVENATHDGLRAQKTPPPGERPGCLPDPGPQRSDRTVRHSAGEAPSLLPPSLADAAADVVDHSSSAFLLKASLRQRRKEEEEEEARKVEMEHVLAVKEQWRARRKVLKDEFMALLNLESRSSLQERRLQELLDALDAHDASKPSSGSSKRKKKKRKKKKLPKAGCRLFPPGCRRLCDHLRQVPAVSPRTLGIPVVTQRQVPTVHSFMLPVQFLDTVFDMLVVVLRQVLGLMVLKTVVVPQLQFIAGVDISFVAQRQFPVVQTIQQIIEVPLSFVFDGRCPRHAGRAFSQVLPWRKHSCSHSCSSLRICRPCFRLRKTAGFPQLQFFKGRRHPRLCAEVDPHGPGCSENHRDSPVRTHGGRCPCCVGRACLVGQGCGCACRCATTGAWSDSADSRAGAAVPRLQAWRRLLSPHVEKTVKIPQLQLVGGAVLG